MQHWWLPHSGQGVRTRISDDRAWLRLCGRALCRGHRTTCRVLDELVPFLEGAPLEAGEHGSFLCADDLATRAPRSSSIARCALDQAWPWARMGLPLFGTGDWNDGMNRVGEEGEGESVWLGWFLHAALTALCAARRGARRDESRRRHGARTPPRCRAAIEREAWDGDWYRRGYFDDGTPLGSAASDECRIDSIAQSWAVISGAATPDRAARAMAAVDQQLIRREDGLALLFTPPFDKTRTIPATSRAIRRAFARTAASTRTPPCGRSWRSPRSARATRRPSLFSLLNPINHARTRADAYRYKVEPYVVAADVYSAAPHVGRGGWTWYTGSAGWMQRAGVESLLGLRLRGAFLSVDPCIPKGWDEYEATVKYRTARYSISVKNPSGVSRGVAFAEVDGVEIPERPLLVALKDDGGRHQINVRLG